jgi:hypothetical protein
MVLTGIIPITDTDTHIHVTGMATGIIPVTVTGTATTIQVTDMGTDTIRAGGIATRGGLGDATGISWSSQAVGRVTGALRPGMG